MRLLVYNIRYATGTGPAFHLPLPGAGYLRSNPKVLTGITEFIRTQESLGQQGIHVKDFVKAIFLDQAICRDGFSRRVFWAGWAYRPQQLPGATL